jgi:uncharacterized protein with FMN-binding domain
MIPRRALGAAIGTIAFLALVIGFKTPADEVASATTTTTPGAVDDGAAGTGSGTSDSSDLGQGATATPTPTPIPSQTTVANETVTGPVVSTRFGDVQVAVTVSGGTITEVEAVQLPNGDRHSSQVSSYAAPILREAALSAQSAAIDIVSGATYTSLAYVQSLQGALDQVSA